MEGEKIEKILDMMNKMLKKNRKDFWKCSLAKNLAKDRFGKLLQ
jgi:hypothetical protein